MNSGKITTAKNFEFIQRSFIEAKTALIHEQKTGVLNLNRIKGVGLEGASRTGKSWDICVFICHYIITYKGKQINVCRDYFSTLKKTFYETLKKVWRLFGLPMHHFNKNATPIHINDNVIRFVGVKDDIATALGLESDLLIINEAIVIDKETSNQLEQRTVEFFIYDYNPSEIEGWIYNLERRNDYKLLKTTIFDNPYAPLNSKAKILSYAHPDVDDFHVAEKAGYTKEEWKELKQRNVAINTADAHMWKVYGLGVRSAPEGLIYKNVEYIKEFPDIDYVYGLDFGFTVDPASLVKYAEEKNNVYVELLLYEPIDTIGVFVDYLDEINIERNKPITADSSDKYTGENKGTVEMVKGLRNEGFMVTKVSKTKGKMFHIANLRSKKIHVVINDHHHNAQKELINYRFKEINGIKINQPVDGNDHFCDAMLYASMSYGEVKTPPIIW